jgi:hypothetical protein
MAVTSIMATIKRRLFISHLHIGVKETTAKNSRPEWWHPFAAQRRRAGKAACGPDEAGGPGPAARQIARRKKASRQGLPPG